MAVFPILAIQVCHFCAFLTICYNSSSYINNYIMLFL